MFFVYAIKSYKHNYIYVGLTNNLERRIGQHNKKQNRSTKPYVPFYLFYYEEFETRVDARIREIFLKNASGKRFLRKVLIEHDSNN